MLEAAGNIKNKGVGNAVKMILEAAEEEEFISEGSENFVSVFVSGKNNSENLEKARNAIRNYHAQTGLQFSYNAETGSMEKYKAFKAEAEGLDITPGKLNLLKKAYGEYEMGRYTIEEPGYVDFKEFAKEYGEKSVKDIMQPFNKGKGKDDQVKDKEDDANEQYEEKGNEENGNTGKGNNSGKGNK